MNEPRPHTSPASPAIVGSILGSYRILSEIATGGMGTVFRAEHVLLHRPAALKLLRADLTTDADLVQRFINEAKAVTACKHPGIVEVYDFGYTDEGDAFIVMEFLEGETLGHRLLRTRLTEPEAAAIAHGIASALKAAHKVGVIHRDLKPDNVFLVPDPDGGPDRTKVLDFGIAKLADSIQNSNRRTATGILMGTPLYMAPEQAREASTIDTRADLYSLGCILYHMLVGHPPFVAEGAGEIISLQMFGEVVPPSQLAPFTPEMEWVVLRLLEKEPTARFDSAAALAAALASFDSLLINRATWPPAPVAFSDLAPTLPPETAAQKLDGETRPGLPSGKRSAIPIVAGAITVLALAGAGLAYAMLRGSGPPAAPATVDPAAGSAHVATPNSPPTSNPPASNPPPTPNPPTPGTQPQPAPSTEAPDLATSRPHDKPVRPGHRVAPGAPGTHPGSTATRPAGSGETSSGPVTRPDSGDAAPDKPSGAVRDIRQVDPAKPGEHTTEGSPIETTLDTGKKPPKPPAPDAAKNGLPSPEPPKDPTPP
jgi:eukaryotic-like serine/threonine-protein kinase